MSFEMVPGTSRERIPGMESGFPYACSRAMMDRYRVPWHWHEQLELFYVESGSIEYGTPHGVTRFPQGTGGLVNCNTLHRSQSVAESGVTVQLVHLFSPILLSGPAGGRMEQQYFALPLSGIELVKIDPAAGAPAGLTEKLRDSFSLDESAPGYELRLCAGLMEIWAGLLPLMGEQNPACVPGHAGEDRKLKQMMVYIHDHYAERMTVPEIAASAYVSERECFRLFREQLRCTPVQYCLSYRLRMAQRMLLDGSLPITEIALACGFGNASYLGRKFAESFGCTPSRFRADCAEARRSL